MPRYLLDSNILILALRGRTEALDLLAQICEQDDGYISVVTRIEILAGMRPREEMATTELLASLPSLAVDPAVADRSGRLIRDSALQGAQLTFADALIAATALEHDLTLVTTNARHFQIAGLLLQSFPPA